SAYAVGHERKHLPEREEPVCLFFFAECPCRRGMSLTRAHDTALSSRQLHPVCQRLYQPAGMGVISVENPV
ncbi:hypothetical protein, partial [Kozakia baliensis]|uniref:hypothetical protein n=1 Tax=Kozakia baliensis TaxID=153496 RepID=UPI0022320DAA